MSADEYGDLPGWIRPGAKLAMLQLGDATMVTVTHLTRTQIVTVADSNKHAIYRFHREERKLFGSRGMGYELMGEVLAQLVRRDHTEVTQACIRYTVADLRSSVRKIVTPAFGKDGRSADEVAMELLDQLENAVRKARRKVEGLLDPGGAVAAEYAQELEPAAESAE